MDVKHSVVSNESWLESNSGSRLFIRTWAVERPDAVIILVHGLGDHSGRFEPVAQTFCRANFSVIGFDALGHGKTGGSMPPFEVLESDLIRVIRFARSQYTAPVLMFGQSLGGGIALHHGVSGNEPVDAIIAGSPLLRPAFKPPAWKILIGRTLGRLWPTLTLGTGLNPQNLTSNPDEVQRYLNDPLILRHVSAALGLSMLEAGENTLLRASQLATPTLIIHGTADRITSAEASREFAERAGSICEIKLWQNMLHDLHFEMAKDQVLGHVVDWIHGKIRSGAIKASKQLPNKPR
ncbi:MAG: lysophospholipase [Pirellula sp.]|jgi:acylglycerol lipase